MEVVIFHEIAVNILQNITDKHCWKSSQGNFSLLFSPDYTHNIIFDLSISILIL